MRGLRIPLGIGAYFRARVAYAAVEGDAHFDGAGHNDRFTARCSRSLSHAGRSASPRQKAARDVWITEVFVAERDREQLESAFRTMVARMGALAPMLNARCRARTRRKPSTPNSRLKTSTANLARQYIPCPSAVSCRGGSRASQTSPQDTSCYLETLATVGSLSPDHCSR